MKQQSERYKIITEHIFRVATLLNRPVSAKDIEENWFACDANGEVVPDGVASKWVTWASRETIKSHIHDLLNDGRMTRKPMENLRSSIQYEVKKG